MAEANSRFDTSPELISMLKADSPSARLPSVAGEAGAATIQVAVPATNAPVTSMNSVPDDLDSPRSCRDIQPAGCQLWFEMQAAAEELRRTSPLELCRAETARVMYARLAHLKTKTWRMVLNHHSTNRPAKHGGPLNSPIKNSLHGASAVGGECRVTLTLQNSFEKGDNCQVKFEGVGATAKLAEDNACGKAWCELVWRDFRWNDEGSRLVLQPSCWSWNTNVVLYEMEKVMTTVAGQFELEGIVELGREILPLDAPRSRRSGFVPPVVGGEADREQEIHQTLEHILKVHGGIADPANLKDKLWRKLDRLLRKGGLLPFLTRHDDVYTVVFNCAKKIAFFQRKKPKAAAAEDAADAAVLAATAAAAPPPRPVSSSGYSHPPPPPPTPPPPQKRSYWRAPAPDPPESISSPNASTKPRSTTNKLTFYENFTVESDLANKMFAS